MNNIKWLRRWFTRKIKMKNLDELLYIHAKLESQIAEGYSNYLSDPHLTKLKQEKRFIKMEIEKIKAEND